MDLNDKLCYRTILLFGLIGVSFNSVIRPRDLTLGTESRNWMVAKEACQKDGLQLLTSITKHNMVDILTIVNLWKADGILTSSVWVGLTRYKEELGYKWNACSGFITNDQLPWDSGHPQSTTIDTCVLIERQTFKLRMKSCFNQYQYICERPREECWFVTHLMQEATDAKLNVGKISQEECEDQCRNFVVGSQECVLIELNGDQCFIVKSDKQYIDDSPSFIPATSSYSIVEVKRCLARSHRESSMGHIAFYYLPPREPCSVSVSSVLPSSDKHHSTYSSRITATSTEVSSYSETSSEFDTDVTLYISSTEITDFSTDATSHFSDLNTYSELSTQALEFKTSSDTIYSDETTNFIETSLQASDTTITDYTTSSIETSLQISDTTITDYTTSLIETSLQASDTTITDYTTSSIETSLQASDTTITDYTTSSIETSLQASDTTITDYSTSSIETSLQASETTITDYGTTSIETSLQASDTTITTDYNTSSIETSLEASDTTITDYSTSLIETSVQVSEDALDSWTTSVTQSSDIFMSSSSLSPAMPFYPVSTVMDVQPSVTSSIPYQTIPSGTNSKFYTLCRCVCLNNDSSVHGLAHTKLTEEIRKKLFVDTATLSSTRRKLTSAEDHRPSAIITGQLGLVVLILVFCFFLILDAQRFIFAIYVFMKKKCTKIVVP